MPLSERCKHLTLSRSSGYVTYLFLTLSPLTALSVTQLYGPFDLHVLATPPAFVLSQDQTLQFVSLTFRFARNGCHLWNQLKTRSRNEKPVESRKSMIYWGFSTHQKWFYRNSDLNRERSAILRSRCFGWYQLLTFQRSLIFWIFRLDQNFFIRSEIISGQAIVVSFSLVRSSIPKIQY